MIPSRGAQSAKADTPKASVKATAPVIFLKYVMVFLLFGRMRTAKKVFRLRSLTLSTALGPSWWRDAIVFIKKIER
jgi:hypothetical protein